MDFDSNGAAGVRLLAGLEAFSDDLRGCVLTIGNFDGVHLGHQAILRRGRQLADADGASLVAMTFQPPPERVLRPDKAPRRLTPDWVKFRLLSGAGADAVLVVHSDRSLLEMTPAEFIEHVIRGRLGARHVVEGPSFFFGHGRSGSVATLAGSAREGGFQFHLVQPVMTELSDGSSRVSSTLIRGLVGHGRVEDAAACMGRPFALYERVVAGEQLGRQLGFPTVNLAPGEQVLPGQGVYAGRARGPGLDCPAAISVGNKPTLGPVDHMVVEAFLLDCGGDLYGQALELSFVSRLRDQVKFPSRQLLSAQIEKDVARVREICG